MYTTNHIESFWKNLKDNCHFAQGVHNQSVEEVSIYINYN